MQKNILKERKKIILFLSLLLIFSLSLTGCNWFGEGILNVFDPKAQIRVNLLDISYSGEGKINLEIYSLNQVEFFGESFSYKYYNKGVLIPGLSKTVGTSFYVAPAASAGTPGPTTEIDDLPLFYQDVRAYLSANPLSREVTCTISMTGIDGAGHKITKPIISDLPIEYFPDIIIILSAIPASFDSNGGTATINASVVDKNYGQPVGGLNVVFTTDGGSLSSNSATTNSNGIATVTLTAPENTTDSDIKYTVTAYIGDESSSTSITVYKAPEPIEPEDGWPNS